MDNAEQPVGKQWRWYTTTSGIWQTVFLEPRHAAHFLPFRISPDLDNGTAKVPSAVRRDASPATPWKWKSARPEARPHTLSR